MRRYALTSAAVWTVRTGAREARSDARQHVRFRGGGWDGVSGEAAGGSITSKPRKGVLWDGVVSARVSLILVALSGAVRAPRWLLDSRLTAELTRARRVTHSPSESNLPVAAVAHARRGISTLCNVSAHIVSPVSPWRWGGCRSGLWGRGLTVIPSRIGIRGRTRGPEDEVSPELSRVWNSTLWSSHDRPDWDVSSRSRGMKESSSVCKRSEVSRTWKM